MKRSQIDVTSAPSRRRFFIDTVRRRGSRGSGSDLELLARLPGRLHERYRVAVLDKIFAGLPIFLIGAHAAAAFAPERMTQAVDYFTTGDFYEIAAGRLRDAGFAEAGALQFATSRLGLYGSGWRSADGTLALDLIASDEPWAIASFAAPAASNANGDRVIPLAFLVLMKLDAARSIDQGDLARVLGRLSDEDVERVVAVVAEHYPTDPDALDDVRQYAEIGRWEYEGGGSAR